MNANETTTYQRLNEVDVSNYKQLHDLQNE